MEASSGEKRNEEEWKSAEARQNTGGRVSEWEGGRNVRVQGEEAVQVDGFKYSGGRGQPSRSMNRA